MCVFFQRDEEEDQTSEEANNYKLPKGSVIYFSGVPNTCTRENIKACLDKYDADIAYIDFQRGLTEGWVRLQGENAAKPLLEKTDGGKVRKILYTHSSSSNSSTSSINSSNNNNSSSK